MTRTVGGKRIGSPKAKHIPLNAHRPAPSQPVPSGLDVERLAKALHADAESLESDPTDWGECPEKAEHREYAKAIASEFAALTAAPAPEEGLREAALAVWRRAQDIDHWRDDDEVAEALVPVLRSALGDSNR